ncbi:MAG: DUF721 domain-containing protein [Brevinematales bacterium]|nr:DUF721 domain-containing protein [Brevinematales bacterium]
MGGRMVSFAEVIKYALNRSLPYGNVVIEIREVWDECVGVVGARHTLPVSYANDELTVLVDDSYWLSELKLYETEILVRLERLVSHPIRKIVWKLVKTLPREPHIQQSHGEAAETFSLEVSEEIRQEIEAMVTRLEDKELREAARNFLVRVFSCQKTLEKERNEEHNRWR